MLPAGLLENIRENPDDKDLCLIAADWYEDDGDPVRAAFIRASINGPKQLADALLRANWMKWWGFGHEGNARYRNGFVESVMASWFDWCNDAATMIAHAPLREVRLWCRPDGLTIKELRRRWPTIKNWVC